MACCDCRKHAFTHSVRTDGCNIRSDPHLVCHAGFGQQAELELHAHLATAAGERLNAKPGLHTKCNTSLLDIILT